MAATTRVAITGTHVSEPGTVLDRSLEEMIFDAAERTVADAGITLADVDAVVTSATDQVDGRIISIMVTAGAAAGVERDLTLVASIGEHALVYGYLRLLAGQGRNVLVLSWGKPSESVAPEHAELVAAEPFVLRPTGMNDSLAAALQASVLAARDGAPDSGAADAFVGWPLRRSDLPTRGDAVCGALLTVGEDVDPDAAVAWLEGVGWATGRYELGDRDLLGLPALRAAAERAFRMAGDGGCDVSSVGVVELQCPSRQLVGTALDALALSGEARASARVNPTWGFDSGYPAHAAGLARMIAAARQANETGQPAVGASLYGFAGQGATVALFAPGKEQG